MPPSLRLAVCDQLEASGTARSISPVGIALWGSPGGCGTVATPPGDNSRPPGNPVCAGQHRDRTGSGVILRSMWYRLRCVTGRGVCSPSPPTLPGHGLCWPCLGIPRLRGKQSTFFLHAEVYADPRRRLPPRSRTALRSGVGPGHARFQRAGDAGRGRFGADRGVAAAGVQRRLRGGAQRHHHPPAVPLRAGRQCSLCDRRRQPPPLPDALRREPRVRDGAADPGRRVR